MARIGYAPVSTIYQDLSPPYSPDFNPFGNAFAKLKALLRARAECTITALRDAAATLLAQFTLTTCTNYFAATGHDPD